MAKKKTPSEGTKKVNNPNVMGLHAAVVEQPITDTLEQNYMPYAMSVIVSRAIPEIDGFKPSHRKLLYTMYKMGLLTGARTKSANIVGQTMRLNPHGDAAIYDTLVRLSKGYGALLHHRGVEAHDVGIINFFAPLGGGFLLSQWYSSFIRLNSSCRSVSVRLVLIHPPVRRSEQFIQRSRISRKCGSAAAEPEKR